jgi:hypothetical protein
MNTANRSDENIVVQNPMLAWARISDVGKVGTWEKGAIPFPTGGHLQGIQRGVANGNAYLVVSASSDTESYFVTLPFNSLESDALAGQSAVSTHYTTVSKMPLRHSGGIHLIGDVLLVGAEDNEGKNASTVFFYDLSNPSVPKKLAVEVVRHGEPYVSTAGAVGIVKINDKHILAVATWNADTIDFYASNGLRLFDAGCQFEFLCTWNSDKANRVGWIDQNWGHYQGTNLFADAGGNLYLVGFNDLKTDDWMDLYALDMNAQPDEMVVKIGKKKVALTKGAHFRYGGGICVHSPTDIVVYATERNVGETTCLNELWHI